MFQVYWTLQRTPKQFNRPRSRSRKHPVKNACPFRRELSRLQNTCPAKWMTMHTLSGMSFITQTPRHFCAIFKVLPKRRALPILCETERQAMYHGTSFSGPSIDARNTIALKMPIGFAWTAVSPRGSRLLHVSLGGRIDAHSLPRFEQFCQETGRTHGVLREDLTCQAGRDRFSFLDCKFTHEDEVFARISRHSKPAGAEKIVDIARRLLACKAGEVKTADVWEIWNDEETHDDALQDCVRSACLKKVKTYQKERSREFGESLEIGTTEHRDIPRSGVMQLAIGKVKRQHLYLAGLHEAPELPVELPIGTY